MAIHDASVTPAPRENFPQRAFLLACFALCVAHAAYLAASYFEGQWVIDADGRGIPTDFVNVWAAGRLVLEGRAADAYDWSLHKQIEDAAVGYSFAGHYGWHYPPPFLAIAALLALLPYTIAYALWIVATAPLYFAAMRWVIGERVGYLIAGAFPAVLANAMVGQNGFLTAALMAGALGFMERHPALAGTCLGLLTYKPQFGILFPLVLAVTGRWKVFAVASVVGCAMALASLGLFGMQAWQQFFHWLPATSQAFLTDGKADWAKLQSIYGVVRIVGGGDKLAWSIQIAVALCAAFSVCAAWRRKIPFDLKAAALATAAMLATPYVYLYDLTVLAIALAFFLRHTKIAGLQNWEYAALAATAAVLSAFPFVKLPVGITATFLVALLIANRCIEARKPQARQPSISA